MIILRKWLRCNQWVALCVLVVGVVVAQSSQGGGSSLNKGSITIGVAAALGVSMCSGFASVYLEKILKGDKTSIWVRNVQLCLFSIPLQFLAIYQRDWEKVQANGWLFGFCWSTWAVVCMFAFGGLLVAVVIRFADNNLKNLAMALAMVPYVIVDIFAYTDSAHWTPLAAGFIVLDAAMGALGLKAYLEAQKPSALNLKSE